MKSLVGLLGCLALASCGMFKKPETFPEQAKAVLDNEGKKQPWMGHLDPDLQPIDGKEGAWSPQSENQMLYAHLAEGEICIRRKTGEQWFPSFGSVDKELAEYETLGRKVQIVFAVHDTLATGAAPWPARPNNTKSRIADHSVEKKPYKDSDQKTQYNYWLEVELEWCAPSPVVTASAHYLTATAFRPEGVPALFVWAIDGTPTPRGGGTDP